MEPFDCKGSTIIANGIIDLGFSAWQTARSSRLNVSPLLLVLPRDKDDEPRGRVNDPRSVLKLYCGVRSTSTLPLVGRRVELGSYDQLLGDGHITYF